MKPINLLVLLLVTINLYSQKIDDANSNTKLLNHINPASKVIDESLFESMQQAAKRMPSSNDLRSTWETIGPTTIYGLGSKITVSGRVRDVNYVNENLVRVAAATGGLWEIRTKPDQSKEIKFLSEGINVTTSGAVATDPFDENVILYGTGEPNIRQGSGMYRSEDGGKNWKQLSLPKNDSYTEIEFTNVKGHVWCTHTSGAFLSKDGGKTWAKRRSGNMWGLAVDPQNSNNAFVANYEGKIFSTSNGGSTWVDISPVTSFDKPIERVELSNCYNQPNVLFACITLQGGITGGIYKTINSGKDWIKCNVFNSLKEPTADFHWGQGWYNSFVSVSPANPDHVIVGGGWWVYSIDGLNFYGPNFGTHADHHACDWSKDGSKFILGNDGGVAKIDFEIKPGYEADKMSFSQEINNLPITQFNGISVSKINSDVMIGGTQDNGLVYYVNQSKKWFANGGDGGNATLHTKVANKYFGLIGLYGGDMAFRTFKKIGNDAFGWQDITNGVRPSRSWGRIIEMDQAENPVLYKTSDNYLYRSFDEGISWELLSGGDVEFPEISSLAISSAENPNLYLTGLSLKNDTSGIYKIDLETFDFVNISKGLPLRRWDGSGYYSYPVAYTPYGKDFSNSVYVLMRGLDNKLVGRKIFVSTDAGSNWINITGNLPELPYTALLVHPFDPNTLVLGTDGFGIYKTNDGGKNWFRWSEGFISQAIITDLDFQLLSNNEVNVVVSTYGNGLFKRYLPANNVSKTEEVVESKKFLKNVHFENDNLVIDYRGLPFKSKLTLFDIKGNLIAEKELAPSNFESNTEVMITDLPKGMYFVNMFGLSKVLESRKVVK